MRAIAPCVTPKKLMVGFRQPSTFSVSSSHLTIVAERFIEEYLDDLHEQHHDISLAQAVSDNEEIGRLSMLIRQKLGK